MHLKRNRTLALYSALPATAACVVAAVVSGGPAAARGPGLNGRAGAHGRAASTSTASTTGGSTGTTTGSATSNTTAGTTGGDTPGSSTTNGSTTSGATSGSAGGGTGKCSGHRGQRPGASGKGHSGGHCGSTSTTGSTTSGTTSTTTGTTTSTTTGTTGGTSTTGTTTGGTTSTTGTTTSGTVTTPSVRLLAVSADSSSQAVTLKFSGALNAALAATVRNYSVSASGVSVPITSAIYGAQSHTVTLALDTSALTTVTLESGTLVSVSYSGLTDTSGNALVAWTAAVRAA